MLEAYAGMKTDQGRKTNICKGKKGSRKGWDPMFPMNTNNLMLDHSNHDNGEMIRKTEEGKFLRRRSLTYKLIFGGGTSVGHETMEPFGCGFSNKNIHAWKARNNTHSNPH
ncbi:unnamed protein product [Dovyalis caffra]|uniref:Uncharacterized protein n=1 Tax=Dovyalis caffra TaxID=77055 RepID=A0AAV1S7E9_9ROSI|nr:unnamed protein product [Dovyalis caffra]